MKKIISMILAMMLVFSMTVTAFAEETKGSITINGIGSGTEYRIYKLLDLESYNKENGANLYSYKVTAEWSAFFESADAKAYVDKNADGYITWIADANDDTIKANFAKLALEYAKTNGIAPVKSCDYDEKTYDPNESEMIVTGNAGKFQGLDLGWYLIDSTAGALCGLTTTDPDASINAKNEVPTIDKQVQEDLSGLWGDVNTADIGQVVNFMTIIHVAKGAENYKLHDVMSDNFNFEHDLDNGRGVTEIKIIRSSGEESTLKLGTDYTVKTDGFEDDCTFEVEFDKTFVAGLKENERLVVYYNAMLNRHAEVGVTEDNWNKTCLEYGEEHFTTYDKTVTYTFSIDIIKTDSSNKLIDGASFRIYDAATGGNEVGVVPLLQADNETPMTDANGNPMYRRARADEVENGETVDIVVKDGKVTVIGFDNGVYYLEEVNAPAGYNKLTARKEFTIADKNLESVFNEGIYSTGSGVHVVNKNGTMLPETGANGTMMFIAFGTVVVLGAGVLLVTKKRMSMIVD